MAASASTLWDAAAVWCTCISNGSLHKLAVYTSIAFTPPASLASQLCPAAHAHCSCNGSVNNNLPSSGLQFCRCSCAVAKLSRKLRQAPHLGWPVLQNERVLFHYNGHGVPRPTVNGEIWVFNKSYTQYIPMSIYDLQAWLGTPCIFVFDCSAAGLIVNSFKAFAEQKPQVGAGLTSYCTAMLHQSLPSSHFMCRSVPHSRSTCYVLPTSHVTRYSCQTSGRPESKQ